MIRKCLTWCMTRQWLVRTTSNTISSAVSQITSRQLRASPKMMTMLIRAMRTMGFNNDVSRDSLCLMIEKRCLWDSIASLIETALNSKLSIRVSVAMHLSRLRSYQMMDKSNKKIVMISMFTSKKKMRKKSTMRRMMSISKRNTSSPSMNFTLKRTNSYLLMGLAQVAPTQTQDSSLSSQKRTLVPGRTFIQGSLAVVSPLRTQSR